MSKLSSEKATEVYHNVNLQTAGKLKGHQLLVEKALVLIAEFKEGDVERQVHIQNIIAQLQLGLNLDISSARELHKSLAYLWDAVESGELINVLRTGQILSKHKETLDALQGRNQ